MSESFVTVARQATLSMGLSRQEYWSGLPCPPPGGLPHPGIKPASLTSPALAGRFFTTSATWEAPRCSVMWARTSEHSRGPHQRASLISTCPTSSLDNHPPDISLHCYAFLWPSCHKPSRNNKYLESQDWHEWTTLINLCQYSDIGLSFRRDNEGGCSQVPSDCLQSFSPNHTPSPYARLGVYRWKGQLGLGAF